MMNYGAAVNLFACLKYAHKIGTTSVVDDNDSTKTYRNEVFNKLYELAVRSAKLRSWEGQVCRPILAHIAEFH